VQYGDDCASAWMSTGGHFGPLTTDQKRKAPMLRGESRVIMLVYPSMAAFRLWEEGRGGTADCDRERSAACLGNKF